MALVKEEKASLKLKAAAVEKKIGGLLERIIESESGTVISAYERKVEELEREKLVLKEKTARCGTVARDFDDTFRTAFDFLSNPCFLWEKGSFEDKRIVLKLTLDSHLEYDWNEGVRTAEFSLPFKALEGLSGSEKEMAERVSVQTFPKLRSFPRLSAPHEGQPLILTLKANQSANTATIRIVSERDGRVIADTPVTPPLDQSMTPARGCFCACSTLSRAVILSRLTPKWRATSTATSSPEEIAPAARNSASAMSSICRMSASLAGVRASHQLSGVMASGQTKHLPASSTSAWKCA